MPDIFRHTLPLSMLPPHAAMPPMLRLLRVRYAMPRYADMLLPTPSKIRYFRHADCHDYFAAYFCLMPTASPCRHDAFRHAAFAPCLRVLHAY